MTVDQAYADTEQEEVETFDYDLAAAIESANIAANLEDDLLTTIGNDVVEGYDRDEISRLDWMKRAEQWLKLASQVAEHKSYPWEGASNAKYPLLLTAAIQFHARAYPSIVSTTNVVRARVVGKDFDGEKEAAALRVQSHMSWQLLEQMPNWESDTDRALFILPLVGIVFKKTYYDPLLQTNRSDLVLAQDVCVDYYATSIETASRVTHIIPRTHNEYLSYVRSDLYLDAGLAEVDYSCNSSQQASKDSQREFIEGRRRPGEHDSSSPHIFLEQRCLLDLDEDGYAEPYIVTVDYETRKVLRIVANFDELGVIRNEKDEIVKITAIEYFTKIPFIPNPDGGFYDVGFGWLLGFLNESANTLLNMLIDSGHVSNLQSGFLARGMKLAGGNRRIKPGEWVQTLNSGEDLRKGILPLPVREPSMVLFNLLNMVINAGQKLASVSDTMTGETPGQNTPFSTTQAVLEQGMKVFTAIYKRIHNAFKSEYKKLFLLNAKYLDEAEYFEVLGGNRDGEVFRSDYTREIVKIIPYSDPTMVLESQKMARNQSLLNLVPMGTVSPQEATKRILESSEHPNIEKLMEVAQPGPDPELELRRMELEHRIRMDLINAQIKLVESQALIKKNESQSILNVAKAEAQEAGTQLDAYQAQVNALGNLIKTSMESAKLEVSNSAATSSDNPPRP